MNYNIIAKLLVGAMVVAVSAFDTVQGDLCGPGEVPGEVGYYSPTDSWTDPDTNFTWEYCIIDEEAVICNHSSCAVWPEPSGAITIPSTLGGKPVTIIGAYAFEYCSGLTSVTIPDSVTNIGNYAFSWCSGLTSVTIGAGVKNANWRDVFYGCSAMDLLTVSSANQNFKFSGGLLLTKDGTEIVYFPAGREYVFIPDSVTHVPYGIFNNYGCAGPKIKVTTDKYGIRSIDGWVIGYDEDILPKKLTISGYRGIADDVFSWSSLKSVTIGEGLKAIGECAFEYCEDLESVSIPASVTTIGEGAFGSCFKLNNISLAKDNVAYRLENGLLVSSDGIKLVVISRNVTSAAIPDGVVGIPDAFFAGCTKLAKVSIPASVEGIGSADDEYGECNAFAGYYEDWDDDGISLYHCPALKTIEVDKDNPHFKSENGLLLRRDDDALCETGEGQKWSLVAVPQALTSIVIPEGVAYISSSSLVGCEKLTSITLPASLCEFPSYDLDDYGTPPPNLVSYKVVDGNPWYIAKNGLLLSVDGAEILAVPSGLTSVTIPASVTSLGDEVFGYSGKLKSFSVEKGNKVFTAASGMLLTLDGELVVVPPGFKTQKSVKIPAGVKRIGDGTFWDFTKLTDVVIPEGVEEIGSYAFGYCESLAKVTLPKSLRVIGSYAFTGCPLKSLYIPDGVIEIGKNAFDIWVRNSRSLCSDSDWTTFNSLCDVDSIPGLVLLDGWLVALSDSFWDHNDPEGYLNDALQSSRIRGIAGGAFDSCSSFLRHVTLPDCVKSIPNYQFGNCSALESVDIPNGVTRIGDFAFVNCHDLTSITIPDSVLSVGENAFHDSMSDIPPTPGVIDYATVHGLGIVDGWVVMDDGIAAKLREDGSFNGELVISGEMGVRGIADGVFVSQSGGCYAGDAARGVTSLVVGDGIVSIGSCAFAHCEDLTRVYVSDSVEYIGAKAFFGCDSLEEVYLPASMLGNVPVSAFPHTARIFYYREDGRAWGDQYTLQAGVSADLAEIVNAIVPGDDWELSASGLPAGLKLVQDKTKGAYAITGVPTKDGTNTVTFTASKKGEASQTATITLATAALPTWAQGTFTGYVMAYGGEPDYEDAYGSATMTVGANGKVSGKIALMGTNWTFAAASYAASDGGDCFEVAADAKAGKATMPVWLMVSRKPGDGPGEAFLNASVEGWLGASDVAPLSMFRNIWKDKETAAEAKAEISKWEGLYTLSMDDGGYMSLTVGRDGMVKATGKLADGTAVSASSPLMYNVCWEGFFTFVWASPSAYKGGFVWLHEIRFGMERGQLDGNGGSVILSSLNPQATGEHGEGFTRHLSYTMAYYDKAKKLGDYYSAMRLQLDAAPYLQYSRKVTYFDENGKKRTGTVADEASAVDTFSQSGLTVAVDDKGAFVVEKATKPLQDRETKEWSYKGANDGALALSFTQATGIFKGSYTFWYDYESAYDETTGKTTAAHASKKVAFEGILVPDMDEMRGFFLWDAAGSYEDPKTGKTKTYKYKESHPVSLEAQ